MQDKGKRNIVESIKTDKCYKFKEDPLVERVALEIDSKMGQHDKRVAKIMREKKILEDVERKLQEVEKKLKQEQELCRREKESQHEQ